MVGTDVALKVSYMRQQKHILALGAALLLAATSQLSALTIGDANYLGSINDGVPASEAHEASYINWLITLSAGAGPTPLPDATGEIYSRIGSTVAGPFPTAVVAGSQKFEDNSLSLTVNAAGFSYALGKYGNGNSGAGTVVWYLPDGAAGDITLPGKYMGKGLSHITLFNPGRSNVPDGGTTAMLLGLALSGIAMLRRCFN